MCRKASKSLLLLLFIIIKSYSEKVNQASAGILTWQECMSGLQLFRLSWRLRRPQQGGFAAEAGCSRACTGSMHEAAIKLTWHGMSAGLAPHTAPWTALDFEASNSPQ